jgi:hypothetical protein
MPLYFFFLCGPDDETHDDVHGTDLADQSSALAHGKRIIRELKEAGGYDDPGWTLTIRNDEGEMLALLPFSDINRLN